MMAHRYITEVMVKKVMQKLHLIVIVSTIVQVYQIMHQSQVGGNNNKEDKNVLLIPKRLF